MSDLFSMLDEGPPASGPVTDSVFLALMPDAATGDAMRRFAEEERARHTLMGRLHAQERLHLSMIGLGEFQGLPERIVRIANAAAASVAYAPFELVFDRVESFHGKPGACPRVLVGTHGLEQLSGLHQALAFALKREGYSQTIKRLTAPHVTLMYADRRVDAQEIDPIRWTVTDVVLVHSLLGKTTYKLLGRWPLRA